MLPPPLSDISPDAILLHVSLIADTHTPSNRVRAGSHQRRDDESDSSRSHPLSASSSRESVYNDREVTPDADLPPDGPPMQAAMIGFVNSELQSSHHSASQPLMQRPTSSLKRSGCDGAEQFYPSCPPHPKLRKLEPCREGGSKNACPEILTAANLQRLEIAIEVRDTLPHTEDATLITN